ncbi:MAG: hypothetical protein AAF715_21175, partial [Myxococcota bacterium]
MSEKLDLRARRRRLAPLATVALFLSAAGCSGGPEAMCEDAFACSGGGDESDLSECVAMLERAVEDAEARDCGDEIDDVYDCWENEFECPSEDEFDYSS